MSLPKENILPVSPRAVSGVGSVLSQGVRRLALAAARRLGLAGRFRRPGSGSGTPAGGPEPLHPEMPPIWYLDAPDITKPNPDPRQFAVKGWIASVHPITRLAFEAPPLAGCFHVDIRPGVDIEKIFGMPAIRFQGECPADVVRGLETAALSFETGGDHHEILVPIPDDHVDPAAQKARKMARLLPLVACPACRAGLAVREDACVCAACGAAYPRDGRRFNFLPEILAKEAAIAPTANVSANLYNGACLNYIHAHRHGLILDCGAGCKGKTYENVVNLEIVDYESTDVLAVAEHLPFRDGVFDVVFSFAVLEHVKDPAAAARELARVLKPGGILFCQAPLLAPVHAYPHHYYNMTLAGLGTLFEGLVDIERLEPLVFGQPVHALSWFLNSYLKGLPPALAEDFKNRTVRELAAPADRHLGAPFVACLRRETREELACCNYVIARKPTAGAPPGG